MNMNIANGRCAFKLLGQQCLELGAVARSIEVTLLGHEYLIPLCVKHAEEWDSIAGRGLIRL